MKPREQVVRERIKREVNEKYLNVVDDLLLLEDEELQVVHAMIDELVETQVNMEYLKARDRMRLEKPEHYNEDYPVGGVLVFEVTHPVPNYKRFITFLPKGQEGVLDEDIVNFAKYYGGAHIFIDHNPAHMTFALWNEYTHNYVLGRYHAYDYVDDASASLVVDQGYTNFWEVE